MVKIITLLTLGSIFGFLCSCGEKPATEKVKKEASEGAKKDGNT